MLVEYFCDEENGLRLRDASGRTLVFHKEYRGAAFVPHAKVNGSYVDLGAPLVDVDARDFALLYSMIDEYCRVLSVSDVKKLSRTAGLDKDISAIEQSLLTQVHEGITKALQN